MLIAQSIKNNTVMDDLYQSKRYKYYVLLFLTAVYAINFIDRQILVILQEPIKAELGLSDTQLGLMTGLAFALFYVTFGIPIARLADSYSRRNIIATSLAVWSGMTALCGMATNFWQLLAARIGVGVGEAGGSPPAHSMISDIFPGQQRGTALSIYSTGIYIGILCGFFLGGWINDAFGWRMAFLVVGLPGILIAILMRFSIREPKRESGVDEAPSTKTTIRYLMHNKAFVYITAAASLQTFMGYAILNWFPSLLMRTHDLSVGETGLWMAMVVGIPGLCGSILGGLMADIFGKGDTRWYVWVPAISCVIGMPLQLYSYWAETPYLALIIYAVPSLMFAMYLGPIIAACHNLVSPRMRALTSAVLFFVINLIGLGLGPLFVGITSDLLAPAFGAQSLRWSLTGFTMVVPIIAVMLYIIAAQHYKDAVCGEGNLHSEKPAGAS